jgi:TfoX/Sxy family transcriptional regulator of competence genes
MRMPKSPDELAARFASMTEGIPGLERRTMFGYPSGFVNDNLVTGLYGDGWHVRVGAADQEALLATGGRPFEPMAGRTMRGYVMLPAAVLSDDAALRGWLDRAVAFGAALPPKPKR